MFAPDDFHAASLLSNFLDEYTDPDHRGKSRRPNRVKLPVKSPIEESKTLLRDNPAPIAVVVEPLPLPEARRGNSAVSPSTEGARSTKIDLGATEASARGTTQLAHPPAVGTTGGRLNIAEANNIVGNALAVCLPSPAGVSRFTIAVVGGWGSPRWRGAL